MKRFIKLQKLDIFFSSITASISLITSLSVISKYHTNQIKNKTYDT